MTISNGRCPPAPPRGYAAPIDTTFVSFSKSRPGARIFWQGRNPFEFSQLCNRFDPLPHPWIDTRVLYAGTSLETAIAEVLLRWHSQIVPGQPMMLSQSAQLNDRRVARFVTKHPLQLIDATGLGLAKIEAAVTDALQLPENIAWLNRSKPIAEDIFNCDASEYAMTQQWCGWLRSQCVDADGLIWVSRQFNLDRCVALFSDRCESKLKLVSKPTKLYGKGSASQVLVKTMVERLGWEIGA